MLNGLRRRHQDRREARTTSVDPKPSSGEFRRAGRVLKPFVRDQRRPFSMAFAMLTFEAITSVIEPVPLAYLIDFLRGDAQPLGSLTGRSSTVAVLSVAIVLIAMINALGDSLAEIYLARGGRLLGYQIRVALYSNLQRLSLGFHSKRRTGDVLLRMTSDVDALEKFVTTSVGDLAGSFLVLIGTLAFLIYRSWQVALVAVLVVPLLALISNWFSTRIRAAAKTQRNREADLASAAQEMLTSIGVVQAYGRADYELERFSTHSSDTMAAALRSASLEARFSWAVKVFEALATTGVVWLGLWLFDRSAITIGTLVLFVLLIQNMFKPTRKIIKEWSIIGKLLASLERIGDLLNRKPAVDDLPGARPAPALDGHVRLDHVTFHYGGGDTDGLTEPLSDGRPVALDDVTLSVAPGEVLAVVGHSGAGKSTVASLIPRLYDVTGGRVLVDGVDVRTYTLDSLRSQVSMVLQETLLFSGTVADNIAYGRSDATPEDIEAAARSANACEFIEGMPEGYDTVLNERASNLSGGQRQRLAIARAFIRDTPILILDEPTTGLDPESTGLVLTALRTLMRGKATIIISHDLNLVRWAHRVVVLRAGRVVQEGTHADLIGQPGTYTELFAPVAALNGAQTEAAGELTTAPNGNGHRSDGAPPPGSLIDLRDNPRVLEELPGLAEAFDAGAMARRFQGAFFPDSPWVVERCRPGKATYVPGAHCLVRYELDVRHRESGATLHPLLLGRLFPDVTTCRRWAGQRLAPLVPAVAGRPEMADLASPVVTFDRLAMAVSAFPLDGDLPTLVGATDEQNMLDVFRRLLPEASGREVTLRSCEVHLGHYGRQHRCVLRYLLTGSASGGGHYHRVVYGKVLEGQRARAAGEALQALTRATATGTVDLRVPEWLGYDAELHLGLLSALPGVALVPSLLRARLAEERSPAADAAALTLEGAIAGCAEAAAELHRSGLALGPVRQLRNELAALDEQLEVVAGVAPALAVRLAENRKELEEAAAACDALPLVPSHGDYTPGQVLFDGARPGVLDFDTVCRAEPALDLGQFLAYLRLATAKQVGPDGAPELEGALVEGFLDRYATTAGLSPRADRALRTRVPVYEQISLLRIAVHSFVKLKPGRLELALRLLGQDLDAVPH